MEMKTVVAPEIEQALVSPPRAIPKAEHLEPFVAAARDVLEQELSSEVQSGKLALANGTCTTHEVTAIIGITGQLTGMAMYGMSEETALAIVGQLMGAPCDELDELALSGVGELANVITGCATTLLAQIGITVDIAALDPGSIFQRWSAGDYDSIYFGFQANSLDPASNLDFWLSSGSTHVWNPNQPSPATGWERTIDDLMQKQAAAPSVGERKRLFDEVQRLFGENLPAIYFVAPRISVATSRRVGGIQPVLLDPKVLWNSDTIFVTGTPADGR